MRRKIYLAAITSFLLILLPISNISVYAASPCVISNSDIARIAVSYEGQWGGQCKAFVQRVVQEAGGSLGTGYRQCYLEVGIEVESNRAMKGDIIQLCNDSDPKIYYNGMHTTIVLKNYGNGSFNVVDSNWNFDEIVRIHDWNPFVTASQHGLQVHFYRLGTVEKGLYWLENHQNPDGYWTYHGPRFTAPNVGLTGLATLAFINYGFTESDSTVNKAISYILSNVKDDGSIWSHYQIYDTSMAVITLLANKDIREKHNAEIENAKKFLVGAQNIEPTYSPTDRFYGGWPYSKGQYWADLSNTQFVLLALHEAKKAGFTVLDETFGNAEIFVTRCQNLKATNPDFSFYDDGGFIYQPSSGIWAGGRSYASMTAAGIWSLHCCGVASTDTRIQKGLEWLATNYYVDQNFPIGNTWLYYYLFSAAKAYFLTGTTMIGGHDWYADISNFLVGCQAADGRWPSVFGEEPDELTTVEAILALETKAPPAVSRSMTFRVDSPVDLHVYDPLERHVGINYTTWTVELEIPGATYSGPGTEPQIITIPDPMAGTYKVELVGKATGPYTLTIEGTVDNTIVHSENYTGTISPGYVYESDVTLSTIVGPLTIWSTEPELVPDFTMSVSPASDSVTQGESTTTAVTISTVEGYNKTVSLSASNQPSGVTVSFSPISGVPSFDSIMTVTTSSTTQTGSYTIAITGTGSDDKVHSTTYALEVRAPDFTLSVNPTSGSVTQGESTVATITASAIDGYNRRVTLSASGTPRGTTISFSPSFRVPSFNSTMTVTTSWITPAGSYTIKITGTGADGKVHLATYTLEVTRAPTEAKPRINRILEEERERREMENLAAMLVIIMASFLVIFISKR